jgi:hypothetical protein
MARYKNRPTNIYFLIENAFSGETIQHLYVSSPFEVKSTMITKSKNANFTGGIWQTVLSFFKLGLFKSLPYIITAAAILANRFTDMRPIAL